MATGPGNVIAPARTFAALLALALAACEEERKPSAPPPASPKKPATLIYTRCVQDGEKPERVIVHIISREPARLEVVKMAEPCTDAAIGVLPLPGGAGSENSCIDCEDWGAPFDADQHAALPAL